MALDKTGIERVIKIPDGYISSKEFEIRTGHDKSTIERARDRGRFPKYLMKIIERGKIDRIMYHESLVEEYKKYSKLLELEKVNLENKEINGQNEINENESDAGSGDLYVEKVRKLKIDRELAELNLQKARNEVISTEDMKNKIANFSVAFRQKFLSCIPRMSPILASKSDVHDVVNYLEREFGEILEELSKIEVK